MRKLNFNNPRRGKQPQANAFLQLARRLRRKRVAYARLAAAQALKLAQREVGRFQQLAAAHRVPVDAMPALPVLPLLPGDDWVQFRRDMGTLKDPVKPAQTEPAPA